MRIESPAPDDRNPKRVRSPSPSDGPEPSVVVGNPGHTPWLERAALGLQRHGLLRAYMAPLAGTPSRSRRALPGFLREELERRATPADLSQRAQAVASGSEVLSVASGRIGLPPRIRQSLSNHRDRVFSRGVGGRLRESDTAVLVAYGAALEAIRSAKARSVSTGLEYAVHHHAFNRSTLTEELRIRPEYAASMQFHDAPRRRDQRLDAELAEVDRVIVFSEFSRRTFVDAGVAEEKVVVNQLGVDVGRFADVQRVEDGTFRVLFLGVLSQRKGLSYLVDGFRRAAIPGSELLLVGAPWRGQRPWAGTRGVRQLSWLDRGEVPALLGTADVLVLPSLVEGLARVMLEAMAAGVPVVATPNTGAEDVVRDSVDGYIVPVRDETAIADRLVDLHEHPARREEMGRAARERARQFSWEHYGDRCAAVFSALGRKGAHGALTLGIGPRGSPSSSQPTTASRCCGGRSTQS